MDMALPPGMAVNALPRSHTLALKLHRVATSPDSITGPTEPE